MGKSRFLIVLLAALSVMGFTSCGKREIADNLDETVFTIGDEKIDLREAMYYVMERESFYNSAALQNYPDNPEKYWEDYLFAAGTLFRTWVKSQAFDICVCDNIYYQEAEADGYELELSDQITAYDEAESLYGNMTDKQKENTGLTVDSLYNVMLKIKYRSKYVEELLKGEKIKAYGDNPQQALEMGGAYYNELLMKYDVSIDEDSMWSELEFGKLTIN
ncbi:MAG: hypothetical protein HFH14_06865 [Lachnospiraceae bacterium]|nr:hypothetical protein [Lachnospiraceae bacterium]